MKIQRQIDVKNYKASGFIGAYKKLVKDTVIPYQYSILRDELPDTEKSHVYANFVNAGNVLKGGESGDGFYGMVFQDSDAAKWIEAAAYALSESPDEELEKKVDDFIDVIAAAQDEDGYLNTYFTIKDREKRWTNLLEAHELYCAGHMMEAGCAYYEATGKRKLLEVCEKNAEHIYRHFITEGNEGFPGHPEIELALMKMYRLTGNRKCLELAEHFINCRGEDPDFYKKEAEKRDWQVWGNDPGNGEYQQSAKPVRTQSDATGHAVRAVYLYTGMADLAGEIDDESLYSACRRLWESITRRRMYVTGGIGSTVHGEAFSVDYDLPSDTAYAETCASCGLVFFASRMLENEIKGEYGDVMENAFYNTVLAGMQLDGKRFFYVNPLEVFPGITGVTPTQRHDLVERPKWYGCACCPPNVARLIESFGKYAYGENEDTAYCHLFAGGEVTFENGIRLVCETDYPYGMNVKYKVSGKGRLAVRIPEWSREYLVSINESRYFCENEDGMLVSAESYDREVPEECEFFTVRKGYAYFDIDGESEILLVFDGNPYFVTASPKVPRLSGLACIKRGPLVFCFEGVDNGDCVTDLSIVRKGKMIVQEGVKICKTGDPVINTAVKLKVETVRRETTGRLYNIMFPEIKPFTARAIPYFCWGNRGVNQMRVWMPMVNNKKEKY